MKRLEITFIAMKHAARSGAVQTSTQRISQKSLLVPTEFSSSLTVVKVALGGVGGKTLKASAASCCTWHKMSLQCKSVHCL